MVQSLPISDRRLERVRVATEEDPELSEVLRKTLYGWPNYEKSIKMEIRPYFTARSELSVWNGILMYRDRIVIPDSLRPEVVSDIHSGHLGLNKCRERAKGSVWWPGISNDLERVVKSCEFCQVHRPKQCREPLRTTVMPDRPWQKVAADLCELKGRHFLVVVDYFSRFIEIAYLDTLASATVIGKMKSIFARWGIPEELVTDNGTQFTSDSFKKLASDYGFRHTTTSPHYPQANGEAESAVKTAKKILQQDDVFVALMAYRSTPISATGVTPAELIMGRRMRTIVPAIPSTLEPKWPDLDQVRRRDEHGKEYVKQYYDIKFGARKLHPLGPGDHVRIRTDKEKLWGDSGTITSANYETRSYMVETDHGLLRRNRRHLQHTGYPNVNEPQSRSEPSTPVESSEVDQPALTPEPAQSSSPVKTVTRSGRIVHRPRRFEDCVM